MNSFVSKATDQSFIDSSNVNDISEPNLISSTNANLNHTITSIVQKEVLKDSDNGETKTKDLKGHQASVLLLDEKISILKKNDYEQSQDVFESIITISEKHPELINQVIKKFQSMENAQTALHELFFNAFRIKNIIFCWALFKCNLQESDSREKLMWDENFLNVLKYLVDKGQNISELITQVTHTTIN